MIMKGKYVTADSVWTATQMEVNTPNEWSISSEEKAELVIARNDVNEVTSIAIIELLGEMIN